ncbi:MAG TPA: hypothetical protein DHW02_16535 [Ktedonobacter sp.]|nr:hypothetical protein [Ktedonobacter sp.]
MLNSNAQPEKCAVFQWIALLKLSKQKYGNCWNHHHKKNVGNCVLSLAAYCNLFLSIFSEVFEYNYVLIFGVMRK